MVQYHRKTYTACVVKLFIIFKIIASSHSERLMVFWLKLHTLGSDQYTHTCIQNSSCSHQDREVGYEKS